MLLDEQKIEVIDDYSSLLFISLFYQQQSHNIVLWPW